MDETVKKQRGELKTARIPIKIVPAEKLRKPDWIRIKIGNTEETARFNEIKDTLRLYSTHQQHPTQVDEAHAALGDRGQLVIDGLVWALKQDDVDLKLLVLQLLQEFYADAKRALPARLLAAAAVGARFEHAVRRRVLEPHDQALHRRRLCRHRQPGQADCQGGANDHHAGCGRRNASTAAARELEYTMLSSASVGRALCSTN